MKKLLLVLLILTLIYCNTIGGEYVDEFLQLGVSARSLGMANSIGAIDTALYSFLINPAGVGYIGNFEINFTYTSLFSLADMNYIGIAKRFGEICIGLNWISLFIDDITIRPDIVNTINEELIRRDSVRILANSKLKTFNDYEDAIFISIGRKFIKIIDLGWKYSPMKFEIPVGLNIKLIRKRLYKESGDGIGVDMGFRIKVYVSDILDIKNAGSIIFGYTLRDIFGTTIYWSTKSQDFINHYSVISMGYIQQLKDVLNVTLSFQQEYRYNEGPRFGLETTYKKVFSIRFGVREYGWSTGAGIGFKINDIKVLIDYSLLRHNELSIGQRISGSVLF